MSVRLSVRPSVCLSVTFSFSVRRQTFSFFEVLSSFNGVEDMTFCISTRIFIHKKNKNNFGRLLKCVCYSHLGDEAFSLSLLLASLSEALWMVHPVCLRVLVYIKTFPRFRAVVF